MKTQIKKELHNKSIIELRAQLKEAKESQRVLRLDQEMGKLKNTSSLNSNRVEIAVISTIINEKFAKERLEEAIKLVDKKEKPVVALSATKAKEGKKAKTVKGGKNE